MPKTPSKRAHPTLKTIAEMSGLAVTTVSRALGDAPDISESTKKRVRKIADDIGYVPNRAGVRLRTGRTQVISLVLAVETNLANHSLSLTNSVARVLRDTNYNLNVSHWFEDEDPLNVIKHIVENGLADGIIFNATKEADDRVAYLMERGFPFATHGRTKWAENHAYFDFDNLDFARLAISQLAARGRKKVGVILPPADQYYSRHMALGARIGAEETGIEVVNYDDFNADSPTEVIKTRFAQRLKDDPDIDALLASSAASCMAAINVIDRHGYKLGDNFDIFSREAVEFLHLFRPEILLVYEDVDKAGRFVSNALLHMLSHPDDPPMQHLEVPTVDDIIISPRV